MRRFLLLVLLAAATPAFGQSLDPRSFVNTPVGINFASLAYGFSTGNVLFDAALALENAELDIHGPTAGYARALDLWGLSGKVDAALGGACIDGDAGASGAAVFDPGDPPPGGLIYFVVVGRDEIHEGTYGRASDGSERPEGAGFTGCDRPRAPGACAP